MSDRRPIGVFDSGVGGLTVLRAIHDLLPGESTIYVGDLGHFPYGPKSPKEVGTRAFTIASFLEERGVKAIVVACNTATAVALPQLQALISLPVIGVVEPGAQTALAATGNGRIGVVATEGTVQSEAYVKALRRLSPQAEISQRACPVLVDLVEAGELDSDRLKAAVAEVVSVLVQDGGCDTVILGCTHYPLVREVFRHAAGPSVAIVDSASSLAQALTTLLRENGLEAPEAGIPAHEFLVTADPGTFHDHARLLFGEDVVAQTIDLPSRRRQEAAV